MHLIMFDIDGTLVESTTFDDIAYTEAVEHELKITLAGDWETYTNVTDSGLLQEILLRHKISTQLDNIIEPIKKRFFKSVALHLKNHDLKEIAGARDFFESLKTNSEHHLAIATGGWRESAEMKLHAAGIDFSNIPLSTSDDCHTRIGIMQNAADLTGHSDFTNRVYFGDGVWDKKACADLNYDFIAIGNNVEHTIRYRNYSEIDYESFIQSL